MAAGTATGFSFREYSGLALSETLQRACELFARKPQWNRLIDAGMRQDWSWSHSARQYVQLYEQTLAQVRPKSSSKV